MKKQINYLIALIFFLGISGYSSGIVYGQPPQPHPVPVHPQPPHPRPTGQIETPKTVFIQSAAAFGHGEQGFLEKAGGGALVGNGDNIQIWQLDNSATKHFTIIASSIPGWYEIYIGNNLDSRLDINKNSQPGPNLRIWEKTGNENQLFRIQYVGEGKYKIYTRNNQIVRLHSANTANGNNVEIGPDSDSPFSEWVLLDANTRQPIDQPIHRSHPPMEP